MIKLHEHFNEWETLSLTAYGVRIQIRVNEHTALENLVPYLPCGWKKSTPRGTVRVYTVFRGGNQLSPQESGVYSLYADNKCLCQTTRQDEIGHAFESDVTAYVAEHALRRVFIHAGVVVWRQQAILIPGRSFSGKSTLVAEFIRSGAIFYSDECAVLDGRGRVHPYPRPLHIRNGERRHTSHTAQELGGVVGTRPLPVSLILITQYKAGANWQPRALSSGEGLLKLLANTYSARRVPETVLMTLREVVTRARILKGIRGEAHQVIASL